MLNLFPLHLQVKNANKQTQILQYKHSVLCSIHVTEVQTQFLQDKKQSLDYFLFFLSAARSSFVSHRPTLLLHNKGCRFFLFVCFFKKTQLKYVWLYERHKATNESRFDWRHSFFNPPNGYTDNIKKQRENIQEAPGQTCTTCSSCCCCCVRARQLRFIQSATQKTNSNATFYDNF